MKTINLSSKTLFVVFIITLAIYSCNNKPTGSTENSRADNTGFTDNEQLPASMNFPNDFRNWHHIKSMILQEGHPLFENFGGIHHIYANDKAYEGYRNNKNFPEGSVIVFDLLEAVSENNAIVEGNRKVIGVMYKNSKIFTGTGGWEFGAYKNLNGEKLTIEWNSACFSCHASKKDVDYVFSDYRQ